MTTFKKNDRIRYTGNSSSWSDSSLVGKLGTVKVDQQPGSDNVQIRLDGATHDQGVYASNIGKVTVTTTVPALDKGVKVRIKPGAWLTSGHKGNDEGTIVVKDGTGWSVAVPGKGTGWYMTTEIEALPVEPAAGPSLPETLRSFSKDARQKAAELISGADAADELARLFDTIPA
ncbi:hypothetical protein AB0M54_45775 [Actinoplanes sp. NPDC051470]|uniref:hypothetical protein n=1 Tax=Actinoplanes sp. NPDC051470 TaxID=3157224 RepID=UPI00341CA5B2